MPPSLLILPASYAPPEGFEFPTGKSAPLDILTSIAAIAGGSSPPSGAIPETFVLFRLPGPDGSQPGLFPFTLHSEVDVPDALHDWFAPLGLVPVPFERTTDGPIFLTGIIIASPALLEDLALSRESLLIQGWRFGLPEDEIQGHGLKETFFAGLLGISLLSGDLSAAATANPPTAAQTDPLYHVNESVLLTAGQPNAKVRFLVDLSAQRAYLMVDDRVAVETRVCTGKPDKATPTGTFRITEKIRQGKISTIYNVELPYWMRLTDRGIGLHIGEIHDVPSSAGCVRLPAGIAATLFDHLPRGSTVEIVSTFNQLASS